MSDQGDAGFRAVGPVEKLRDNDVRPYYLRDRKLRINVARVEGRLYAFGGLCAHKQCPLSGGLLEGATIMCQCHGSKYDLQTGAVVHGPATNGLAIYDVREHEGEVQVRV